MRPAHLDCGYVWIAGVVHREDCPLREIQLLRRPGLLVGPMEVHVAAALQPRPGKSVILHREVSIDHMWSHEHPCGQR